MATAKKTQDSKTMRDPKASKEEKSAAASDMSKGKKSTSKKK